MSVASTSDGVVFTPCASTPTLAWSDRDSCEANENQPTSREGLPPDPKDLVNELALAVNDLFKVFQRFGTRMARNLQSRNVKEALFPNRDQLRLKCLRDADSFHCRPTKGKKPPVPLPAEGPLLSWFWEPLLDFFAERATQKFTLKFARATGMVQPYHIDVEICSVLPRSEEKVKLTAVFPQSRIHEKRVYEIDMTKFEFPAAGFDERKTPLPEDQVDYKGHGSFSDAFDYLISPPESIWRKAMQDPKKGKEVSFVESLVDECRLDDDRSKLSDQDLQWTNLLERLPPLAREYIQKEGLTKKNAETPMGWAYCLPSDKC